MIKIKQVNTPSITLDKRVLSVGVLTASCTIELLECTDISALP